MAMVFPSEICVVYPEFTSAMLFTPCDMDHNVDHNINKPIVVFVSGGSQAWG